MTEPNEMLRRLRSGMNAMFDTASADVAGMPFVSSPNEEVTPAEAERWKEKDEQDRKALAILSGRARELKLDDSAPKTPSGYSRQARPDPDFSFTDEEIAYMSGGAR